MRSASIGSRDAATTVAGSPRATSWAMLGPDRHAIGQELEGEPVRTSDRIWLGRRSVPFSIPLAAEHNCISLLHNDLIESHTARVYWVGTAEIARVAPAKACAASVVISAAIESEVAQLADPEEKAEFLEALGLEETGLNRLIRAGYDLLHLITYFTVGPKEARAWTIHRGTRAPAAAGVIHTDFEKGFIRAETIAYDDYVSLGGEAGARDAGKLRLEGKDYVVADGDVMHFRFNN